jgi:flagellin
MQMGLSIQNNVASITAQNNLNRTNNMLGSSLEKLSTGLKVNRGADAPAALVISEQQRAQISGIKTAIDNTNKAISVVQTGEGALNEMNSLLNKVRSLAIDSANTGVNDSQALAANQSEMSNILTTIDRIAGNTQFGSRKLLDGSSGTSGVSTGTDVSVLKSTADTQAGSYGVTITTAAEKAVSAAGTSQTGNLAADETLTVNKVQIKLTAGMSQQQVIDKVNEYTNQTGVKADTTTTGETRLMSTQFGSAAKVQVVSSLAASATSSGFGTTVANDTGVDIAGSINGVVATGSGNTLTATSGVAKGLVVSVGVDSGGDGSTSFSTTTDNINVSNNSLSFQIGANAGQTVSFSFDKVDSKSLGTGASSLFSNLSQITTANGDEALKVIDQAINDVSTLRGRLGAFQQNTLQSNSNNLQTSLQNTVASESVVRDTDYATEIANYTKAQVQMQAGSTVLGNANQMTSMVANLLRG